MGYGELTAMVRERVGVWGLEGRVRIVPCAADAKTSEDGVNTLLFSRSERGRASDPYGRTILYTRRLDPNAKLDEIIEADVELYVAAVRETQRHGPGALESIIAHELGHVWGLAHSCSFLKLASAETETLACPDLLRAGASRRVMFPAPAALSNQFVVTQPTAEERGAVLSAYGVGEREGGWLPW